MRIQAIRKMPLSIDEAGSRCTQTRGRSRKEARPDGGEGKRSRGKFKIFMKSLRNLTMSAWGKQLPKRNNPNN
jgi:hypothetical protein